MKSVHFKHKLSAFIDRELSKEEQQQIAEHLLICSDCRTEHDELMFTARIGEKVERADAPASVWAGIESTLNAESPFPQRRSSSGRSFNFPALAGYAAAVVFLVGFVSIAYFFLISSEPYVAKDTPAGSPSLPPSLSETPSANVAIPGVPEVAVAPSPNANTVNPPIQSANTDGPLVTSASFGIETLAGKPQVGSRSTASQLAVGDFLETDGASRARIEVADIGIVDVQPNTRIKLVGTQPEEHRLSLERGKLHARIAAPPRLFIVDTPSSTAVDLGCEYTLEVDKAGNNRLHVTSGFVALERAGRESIVPAGAMCLTQKGKGLGTPFSADTSERFRLALERFDFASGGSAAVDELLASKSGYDIISLWHLLSRVSRSDRDRIFEALASYVEPPSGVTREGIARLNKKMLDAWRDEVERVWFE